MICLGKPLERWSMLCAPAPWKSAQPSATKYRTIETVLAEVERTYLVDLHDTAFFNQLAIHLQSLYHRSRYDTFTRNNSLMDLKSAYPLTYDLAVRSEE